MTCHSTTVIYKARVKSLVFKLLTLSYHRRILFYRDFFIVSFFFSQPLWLLCPYLLSKTTSYDGLFVMPFILWLSSTYLFQTSSLISINSLMQHLKFSEKHLHYKFPYQRFLFYYHCYQTKYILYNFHTHPSVYQQ